MQYSPTERSTKEKLLDMATSNEHGGQRRTYKRKTNQNVVRRVLRAVGVELAHTNRSFVVDR